MKEDWATTLITWGLYAVGACAVICACVLLLPLYALSVWVEEQKPVEKLAVRVVYKVRQRVDTSQRRLCEMWSRRHDN